MNPQTTVALEERNHDDPIILYMHQACPTVPTVRAMLERASVPYEIINIYNDSAARIRVQEINNGYESVPTLVFPDGSTLTEPSAGELRNRLEALGYEVPVSAMIAGNLWLIVIAVGVGLAILRAIGVF